MSFLRWTKTAVDTANTNKDGSGTVVEICTIGGGETGEYVDTVIALSLGTNVTTEATVFASNGDGLGITSNNVLLGIKTLPATSDGSIDDDTDKITFHIGRWLDEGFKMYALVYQDLTSGDGWQFIASIHPSYQEH